MMHRVLHTAERGDTDRMGMGPHNPHVRDIPDIPASRYPEYLGDCQCDIAHTPLYACEWDGSRSVYHFSFLVVDIGVKLSSRQQHSTRTGQHFLEAPAHTHSGTFNEVEVGPAGLLVLAHKRRHGKEYRAIVGANAREGAAPRRARPAPAHAVPCAAAKLRIARPRACRCRPTRAAGSTARARPSGCCRR